MTFSRRVGRLPTYPMAELPAIKRRLIEQGVDVIDVGAGDADFPPPDVAVQAVTRALQDPAMSRYAFQLGLPAFREAAAAYMRRRFGVSVDPFKELHPLLGSKEGIAHLGTALLNPGDVAVEFHSLSKSFCMTGWRLGWAVGRPDRIAALARVKNYVDTGAFLAVQTAGAEVLKDAERIAAGYAAQFKARRDAILPALRANGFEVETPRATLYVWVPLPEGLASAAFQKRALEDVGVVTLPGSAFGAGAEGFFRIALTVPTPRLIEATERLGKVLATV